MGSALDMGKICNLVQRYALYYGFDEIVTLHISDKFS